MKTLKKTILVFIAALVVLSIAAFLLPESVQIKSTTEINTTQRIVFSQLNDLQSWQEWVSWNQAKPEGMKFTYQNGGVGTNASYQWTSTNQQSGNGKLTITHSFPHDSIAFQMDFMEGGKANGTFHLKKQGLKTEVEWNINYHLGNNPFHRWMGLMLKQMMGADQQKSLSRLDSLCNDIVQKRKSVVEFIHLQETTYAGIIRNVKWENSEKEMSKMYQQIADFIDDEHLKATGQPFVIYHSMNADEMNIECGIPVNRTFRPQDAIVCHSRAGGQYAFSRHTGSYATLEKTHTAIQEWITAHGFSLNGGPMEEYISDAKSETDPAQWITNIYYPLK